jgi:hypothetical protein
MRCIASSNFQPSLMGAYSHQLGLAHDRRSFQHPQCRDTVSCSLLQCEQSLSHAGREGISIALVIERLPLQTNFIQASPLKLQTTFMLDRNNFDKQGGESRSL